MSYYFVANISINEAKGIFKKYKGKYLAVDNTPVILEGNWNYTRLVIIEFETEANFKDWYYSNDYQNILTYRLKAADCDSVFVSGI